MLLRRLLSILSYIFFSAMALSCKIWLSPIQHKTCTAPYKQNKDVLMVNFRPCSEITALLSNRSGLFAYKKTKKEKPRPFSETATRPILHFTSPCSSSKYGNGIKAKHSSQF